MELKLKPIQRSQRDKATGKFVTGIIPWNKGTRGRMPAEGKGRFEKGQLPHNTRKDGDISIRRDSKTGILYKYIRVSVGKWVLLHRHVWQQHHGEIPRGHVVVFKNGDRMNCNINNLEMLSNRQHLDRNRNYEKFSESLTELWKREKIRLSLGLPPLTKHGERLRRSSNV